jgi:hypothetical protein
VIGEVTMGKFFLGILMGIFAVATAAAVAPLASTSGGHTGVLLQLPSAYRLDTLISSRKPERYLGRLTASDLAY